MVKTFDFGGENIYYHVFNRGVEQRDIFLDESDYNRFLFLVFILQGEVFFDHISRLAKNFQKEGIAALEDVRDDILAARNVQLVSFTLMPNHFHMILKESKEAGVSRFIQRLCNSYAKYFNIKNDRAGHLFGSRFHHKLIDSNEYLLHLSAYIHRNARELKNWKNKEDIYPWSSYQDFVRENRWGQFLERSVILDQFAGVKEYEDFIKTSLTKLSKDEIITMANI